MRVLVGCEFSGIVRDCFNAMSTDSNPIFAVSCDILPTEALGPHIQDDLLNHINDGYDLVIAHPPCTYLSSSGLHWNKRKPERQLLTDQALEFIQAIWDCNAPKLCIENPVGCISTRLDLPKPQYIQPYEFGEDASKKTGLWTRGLPPLVGTSFVEPRIVDGKKRWANQSDAGQSRLGGGSGHVRSVTYFGIAAAMAEQWT